jgi:hypothetical protein
MIRLGWRSCFADQQTQVMQLANSALYNPGWPTDANAIEQALVQIDRVA